MTQKPDPNAYPRNPMEAMQCKLAAVASIAEMRRTKRNLGESPTELADYEKTLMEAEIFQWCDHTATQVLAAAATYPLEANTHYQVPDVDQPLPRLMNSFLTFDRGLFPRRPHLGDMEGISALLIVAILRPTGVRQYGFVGLDWDGGMQCWPAFTLWWPPSSLSDEDRLAPDNAAALAETDDLMRFLLTASQFVEQKICVEGRVGLNRAGRKLAQRASISPMIHTIQLRAREQTSHEGGGHGHVEYTCRWIVRGHWRQQPYPKTGDVRPVFIDAYVKGPDDQPLKTPAPDVFVVKR